MSDRKPISYAENLKVRFILIYGLIGFFTTIILLIYLLASGDTDSSFFYAVVGAVPVLGVTSFLAWLKYPQVASVFALISVFAGCAGSVMLDFSAFLSLLMVFVLSTIFISINRWQAILSYSFQILAVIVKLRLESGNLQWNSIDSSNLDSESILYIGLFMFSIFSYSLIINYLINRGINNSAKLAETSRQLQETITIKDQFLTLISHDLRGPIGSLASLLKLLKEKKIEPSEEILKTLSDTSRNTDQLLNSLLLWSKIQKSDSLIKPERFPIKKCIEETLEILANSAEKKRIKVTVDCDDSYIAYADESMVSAVIRNITSNAIKFSHPDTSIKIWGEKPGNNGQIKINVEDEGVGMPEELTDKLFNEDNNLSRLGTENEQGSGMGLVLANDFVKANKGEIGVESEVGKGTRFWFTLPT